jgi:hypothetical protein
VVSSSAVGGSSGFANSIHDNPMLPAPALHVSTGINFDPSFAQMTARLHPGQVFGLK